MSRYTLARTEAKDEKISKAMEIKAVISLIARELLSR